MAIRDTVQQERTDEAQLDNELAVAAEKAAALIQEHEKTIEAQTRRIKELESHDAEAVGVISEGSAARSDRMARKRRALEMLRQAGVAGVLLLAAGLAYVYPNPYAREPLRAAAQLQEAPPADFPQRSAA